MSLTNVIKRNVLVFLSLLLLFEQSYAEHGRLPVSNSLPELLKSQEFYIAKVEDFRINKSRAQILAAVDAKSPLTLLPMENASFPEIRTFLLSSFVQNQQLRPVIIRIKDVNVSEKVEGNRVSGNVRLKLSFHLQKNGEVVDLVEYQGEGRYARGFTNKTTPVSALQQSLTQGLKFFITWMNQERLQNPKLARGVRFHFKDYLRQEADTVYYSSDRPLTWADFKDHPRNSLFGAEVFAGFGFDQDTRVENGLVNVTITTKVFVPKSASWVRPDNRNSYALNHEQRHFDLTKIISERFKRSILQANLTLENYEGFLGPHYFETLRQMNRLQEQYDHETQHGSNRAMQEVWNQKIDAELKSFRVEISQEQ